ncbi:MAG: T9SS type A sorting domain-containing protein [Fibromonadales bacterium]|nr:T9SS type A sorting domain-containing protein [Fibromonadales bacterium]
MRNPLSFKSLAMAAIMVAIPLQTAWAAQVTYTMSGSTSSDITNLNTQVTNLPEGDTLVVSYTNTAAYLSGSLTIPANKTVFWNCPGSVTSSYGQTLNLSGEGIFEVPAGSRIGYAATYTQHLSTYGVTVKINGTLYGNLTFNSGTYTFDGNNLGNGTISGSVSFSGGTYTVTGGVLNASLAGTVNLSGGTIGGYSGSDLNMTGGVITGAVTHTGNLDIKGGRINGAVTTTGNFAASGNTEIYGSITAGGNVTLGGNVKVSTSGKTISANGPASIVAISGSVDVYGSTAISASGATAKVNVSGGNIFGTSIGIETLGSHAEVNVSGGTVASTSGTGIYTHGSNSKVAVTGGLVESASGGLSISSTGQNSVVSVSGTGVVFGYGPDIMGSSNVIDNQIFSAPSELGTVIAFDEAKSQKAYTKGETTDLTTLPKEKANWTKGIHSDGIDYANSSNTGFIPIDLVSVSKRILGLSNLIFSLPSNIVYNGSPQGIESISANGKIGSVQVKYNGIAAIPTNAGTYTVIVDVAEGEDYEAASNIMLGSFTIGKASGAAVVAATLNAKTKNSITINAVATPANGQTVEYSKSTIPTAPAEGWQTSLEFDGLSDNTTYYIFARAKENSNYNAGIASVSDAISVIGDKPLISSCTVSNVPAQTYTGEQIKPSIAITCNSSKLMESIDYILSYGANLNVAEGGSITISGINSYAGTTTIEFAISPKNLSAIQPIESSTNWAPQITVKDGGKILVEGTDYIVSYSNNSAPGIATATATGKGNYAGTVSENFEILGGITKAHVIGKTIMLQNLQKDAKVNVYNLSGQLIYNSQLSTLNSQLKIDVQTKGIYIVKTGNQTLKVTVK